MSYKAMYRKYRPQTFLEVAGQNHVTRTLKNAINEKKIAHAYLFAGPRGTGKTTIAKIFAKAINCTGENVPCETCENCISITQGDHPDVIEIDAASNNGVDEVRNIIDRVKYAPIKGKYKVYIIDEVHMMTAGAFNALLKTLEEPPANVVFILATTEPHKILPTIISRCQRFDFKRVDEIDIIGRLKYILDLEKRIYEEDALDIISKLADGGMRDALSILEQCLAFDEHLTIENVNQVYGLLSNESKIKLIKLLLSKNMKGVLQTLDQLLDAGIDLKRLTDDLIDVLKDIIIYKNTEDYDLLSVLHKHDINTIVPYILAEEAFEMIDIFVEASQHYLRSIDATTYFEISLLKICNHIKEESKIKDIEVVEVIEKKESIQKENVEEVIEYQVDTDIDNLVEEIEEKTIENTIEEKIQAEPQLEIREDIEVSFDDIINILVQAKRTVLNDIQSKWPIIDRYRHNLITAKFASMLADANPVAAGENGIIITYKYSPEVNEANYSLNYYPLKNFLKEVLGNEYDYIAVLEEEWADIRNRYIELNRKKALPQPKPIVLHHIKEFKEKKRNLTDAQQMAIELFGDIVEIEE